MIENDQSFRSGSKYPRDWLIPKWPILLRSRAYFCTSLGIIVVMTSPRRNFLKTQRIDIASRFSVIAHIELFSAARKNGCVVLSMRSSRSYPRWFADRKLRAPGKWLTGFAYGGRQSYRRKSFVKRRTCSDSRNDRDLSLYTSEKQREDELGFESNQVRLHTCHSCHEVINKRHPVPSRRYCTIDP